MNKDMSIAWSSRGMCTCGAATFKLRVTYVGPLTVLGPSNGLLCLAHEGAALSVQLCFTMPADKLCGSTSHGVQPYGMCNHLSEVFYCELGVGDVSATELYRAVVQIGGLYKPTHTPYMTD